MNFGMSEPGCRRVMLGAMVPAAAMVLLAMTLDAMIVVVCCRGIGVLAMVVAGRRKGGTDVVNC